MRNILIAMLLSAAPAAAQDWVTPEVCAIGPPDLSNAKLYADIGAAGDALPVNGVGRLWRVEAPGGKVSHLWGSMHDTHPKITAVPRQLQQIIKKARIVAPEFDPRPKSRAEITQTLKAEDRWRKTDGLPSPHDWLNPEERSWIEARMTALAFEPEWLDYFTLPALFEFVLSAPCMDFNYAFQIQDYEIMQDAVEAGATIVGMEPSDQIKKDLSDPKRRATAIAAIRLYVGYLNPEAYQMEPPLAFGQYIKGAIGLMMTDDRAAALKYFGAEEGARIWGLTQAYLVDERNRGFLETIAPELQRGGVLMVMGAFHLPGDTGMVAILRDAGFTVTRVPTDGELP